MAELTQLRVSKSLWSLDIAVVIQGIVRQDVPSSSSEDWLLSLHLSTCLAPKLKGTQLLPEERTAENRKRRAEVKKEVKYSSISGSQLTMRLKRQLRGIERGVVAERFLAANLEEQISFPVQTHLALSCEDQKRIEN
jgi:hypothetical protein